MQSKFLTSLITEDLGNDLNRLVQPLRFNSAKYGILEAPEGFVTNFMSVPRFPAFVFAWLGGRYKSRRPGEEKLDLIKCAHYIQLAYDKAINEPS